MSVGDNFLQNLLPAPMTPDMAGRLVTIDILLSGYLAEQGYEVGDVNERFTWGSCIRNYARNGKPPAGTINLSYRRYGNEAILVAQVVVMGLEGVADLFEVQEPDPSRPVKKWNTGSTDNLGNSKWMPMAWRRLEAR